MPVIIRAISATRVPGPPGAFNDGQATQAWQEIENFADGGSDGATFSASSGLSDGGGVGGSTTITYAAAASQWPGGTLGVSFATSAGTGFRLINFIPGLIPDVYVSFIVKIPDTSGLAVGSNIIATVRSGSTNRARLAFVGNTGTTLRMNNNLTATGTASSTIILPGVSYLIDWWISSTYGVQGWRLYDLAGNLLEERLDGAYNQGTFDTLSYGIINAPTGSATYLYDRVGYNTRTWLGPVNANPYQIGRTETPTLSVTDISQNDISSDRKSVV